ncbi:MAG: hypothetical protein ACOYXA_03365 [Bacteroidota bacterium]
MTVKKGFYLFLALLLPGIIFIFLKKFGKNEFNLPVYEAAVVGNECPYTSYPSPYAVPDSLWKENRTYATLFVFPGTANQQNNLEKLWEEFSKEELKIVDVTSSETMQCVLMAKQPYTTVLVDQQKRIRGYYLPDTREEFDRLKMEITILLKRY